MQSSTVHAVTHGWLRYHCDQHMIVICMMVKSQRGTSKSKKKSVLAKQRQRQRQKKRKIARARDFPLNLINCHGNRFFL